MNLIVHLFGPQADLVGTRELSLEAHEGMTISELRVRLGQTEERLKASLPSSRFALNHEFVSDDARVHATDEVALIGMVAGG